MFVNGQNYQATRRKRRTLSDLLELEVLEKRRERQWKERLGHQRQVEHALLEFNSVLPSTSADTAGQQKAAPVSISIGDLCCAIYVSSVLIHA